MHSQSIFSRFSRNISKRVLQFSLGAIFMVSGGVFASVNSGISLPPVGSAGDIITVEYWNQLINGTRELDERTKEIHSDNGNVVVGGFNKSDANNYVAPVEQLDVRGAIKIGDTTSENSGAIRFTKKTVDGAEVSDFEGYTGTEWKSLTKGEGGVGSGEACTFEDSSINFATETEAEGSGIVSAGCENGTISYASVEWGSNPGVFQSSLALITNPSNVSASINTLGNPAKIHLICCAGGAGTGGANDELAQLNCANDNIPKWSAGLNKWTCANDDGGASPWSVFSTGDNQKTYIKDGKVGIGTNDPQATLHVSGDIFAEGGIRVGYIENCSVREEGYLRFDRNRKVFEGCNGQEWVIVSDISPQTPDTKSRIGTAIIGTSKYTSE